jgi:hypothetical protein
MLRCLHDRDTIFFALTVQSFIFTTSNLGELEKSRELHSNKFNPNQLLRDETLIGYLPVHDIIDEINSKHAKLA